VANISIFIFILVKNLLMTEEYNPFISLFCYMPII